MSDFIPETKKVTIDQLLPSGPMDRALGEVNAELQNIFENAISAQVLNSGELISNLLIKNQIRSGQTDYNTGVGWWLGLVEEVAKFSIGNPSTNYLLWDGVSLQMKGSLSVGNNAVINFASYTVANLPVTPTSQGFNVPSAYDA